MRYRWKKIDNGHTETWVLFLILDGKKHSAVEVSWHEHVEKWIVFVSGYVSEDTTHVEDTRYDLLCDAKREVMDYMQVWWVSGAFQRLSDKERDNWVNL